MKLLKNLFDRNAEWAAAIEAESPGFFDKLSKQQSPELLWIGCSDSRVSANQIVDVLPGEVFVHRNVGNVVIHTDLNCLSVMHYAVEVLKVKHIIVCGHYGCGAVVSALTNNRYGLIDNWLRNIKDIYYRNEEQFTELQTDKEKSDLLCELNVIEQVSNVCHTAIVQDAWDRGQALAVHGWIYGIHDGLLKDLNVCITKKEEIPEIYRITKRK